MSDSILESVRIACSVPPDYTAFDNELIMHTNSVFMILKQLGVGPEIPFSITGETETWSQFEDVSNLQAVKDYVGLRVKLLFDPNGSSYVISALKEQVSEIEWRLTLEAEEVKSQHGE